MKKSTSSIARVLTFAIFWISAILCLLLPPFSRFAQAQTTPPTSLPIGSVQNALSLFRTNTWLVGGVIEDEFKNSVGNIAHIYNPASGTVDVAVSSGMSELANKALDYSNKSALFHIILVAEDENFYGLMFQTNYFYIQNNGGVYSLPPEATAVSFDYECLPRYSPIPYPDIAWAQLKYNFGNTNLDYTADSRQSADEYAIKTASGKLILAKYISANPDKSDPDLAVYGFAKVVTSDGRIRKYDLSSGASVPLDPIKISISRVNDQVKLHLKAEPECKLIIECSPDLRTWTTLTTITNTASGEIDYVDTSSVCTFYRARLF